MDQQQKNGPVAKGKIDQQQKKMDQQQKKK